MKSILITIDPVKCFYIIERRKTIELLKSRPKMETPFKCYIYCSNDPVKDLVIKDEKGYMFQTILKEVRERMTESYVANGTIIGEFVCDKVLEFESEFYSSDKVMNAVYIHEKDDDSPSQIIQSIVASNEYDSDELWLCRESCLEFDEIKKYIGFTRPEKIFYGWHISDLVVYKKPKELKNLLRWNRTEEDCVYQHLPFMRPDNCKFCGECHVKRAPTSWCYVEEVTA